MEQELVNMLANVGGGLGAAVPVFAYLFLMWRRSQQQTAQTAEARQRELDERHRDYQTKIDTIAEQVRYLYEDRRLDAEVRRRKVEDRLARSGTVTPAGGTGSINK